MLQFTLELTQMALKLNWIRGVLTSTDQRKYIEIPIKFNIKPTLIELIKTQIKCVVELIDNVCLYLFLSI